jgi:hypothetical protein
LKAHAEKLKKFEAENTIDTKQNHLTGYLQTTALDRGKFMEQYH